MKFIVQYFENGCSKQKTSEIFFYFSIRSPTFDEHFSETTSLKMTLRKYCFDAIKILPDCSFFEKAFSENVLKIKIIELKQDLRFVVSRLQKLIERNYPFQSVFVAWRLQILFQLHNFVAKSFRYNA